MLQCTPYSIACKKAWALPSHKPAKKQLLTERMKKQRIAFAKKYIHWTRAQWKRVMSLDESNFQVFRVGSPLVRRPHASSRFDPRFTVPTVSTRIQSWYGELFLGKWAGLACISCQKQKNE